MQRWQYKTVTYSWDQESHDLVWNDTKEIIVDAKMVDKRLNELGGKGWELVFIDKMSDISHVAVCFYLKRPMEEKVNRSSTETPGIKFREKTGM